MQERTAQLGTAPLGGLLLRLSLPSIVGMLLIALYNTVDAFFVSRLGEDAVAALTVVLPWHMIVGALGVSTSVGTASFVSRRFGEGKTDEANRAAGQAILMIAVFAAVVVVLGLYFTDPVLRLFGAQAEVLPLAREYMLAVIWGVPFVMFMMASGGLYRGSGNTVFPMITMSTTVVANAILAPLMIFGYWIFPQLGMQGAGYSTALAQLMGCLASAAYLWSGLSGYRVRLSHFAPNLDIVRSILHVGSASMVMQLFNVGVLSFYNHVLSAQFGTGAVAAWGINFRILGLVLMPMFGIAQGLMPIVGFNFGAQQYRRMWEGLKIGIRSSGLVALGATVAGEIFAPQIALLFDPAGTYLHLTTLAVRLSLMSMVLVAFQIMVISSLQGMGFGGSVLLLSLARQVLFLVPGLYLLSEYYGVLGAFAAQPLADGVSFVLVLGFLVWVRSKYRRATEEVGEETRRVAEEQTPAAV